MEGESLALFHVIVGQLFREFVGQTGQRPAPGLPRIDTAVIPAQVKHRVAGAAVIATAKNIYVAFFIMYGPGVVGEFDAHKGFGGGVVFPIRTQKQPVARAPKDQGIGIVSESIHGSVHIALNISGIQRPAHAHPGGLGVDRDTFDHLAVIVQAQLRLQTSRSWGNPEGISISGCTGRL